jgi:hypothetical protein
MRRLGWLLVPALAVLVWWLVRGGDPTTQSGHADRAPAAVAPAESAGGVSGAAATSRDPASPDRAISPGTTGGGRSVDPAARSGAANARGPTAPSPSADPAAPPRLAAPPAGSGSAAGDTDGLTDKTGWDDKSAIKQLNKELMPLVSECIDQSKARNPQLHGMLALSMVVAPTDNHKVIVSAKPTPANQIHDAELLECIQESSFSIEGLKAPHDFQITLRIEAGSGSG